ncbi:MAG: glycosyltransferase family 4 protein [Cellvibrio sp.]|uniref:MraY family glycosyltransferase n=1 Tax=Cellvibrio sp. TaxID=1965322 RepID=UPI0031AE8933
MTKWLILFILPLLSSLILCRLIIVLLGRRLLDTPNSRSSHTSPTPRGGGIALAASSVIATIAAWKFGYISSPALFWFLIPGGIVALLGIADDLFSLGVGIRLIVQIVLAGLGIAFIGVTTELSLAAKGLTVLILILFLVWMTNLYNFMDGINGLAALEAISVCIGMGLIYSIEDTNRESLCLMIIISASALGFLYWNFPKAKIFMGDSGSLFLGISFGLLAIKNVGENNNLVAAWLIMLGVFIVDASYTLFVRLITKQAFHQAHRTHAYQIAAIQFNSHTRTTFAAIAINLLWLFPLALSVSMGNLHPIIGLTIAYAPLLILTKKYNAGIQSTST